MKMSTSREEMEMEMDTLHTSSKITRELMFTYQKKKLWRSPSPPISPAIICRNTTPGSSLKPSIMWLTTTQPANRSRPPVICEQLSFFFTNKINNVKLHICHVTVDHYLHSSALPSHVWVRGCFTLHFKGHDYCFNVFIKSFKYFAK